MFGLPLLAGDIKTRNETSVILEQINGFTIPSPLALKSVDDAAADIGTCPTSVTLRDMAGFGVKFGVDVSSGCVFKLNR